MADLIDRQAAINAVKRNAPYRYKHVENAILEDINVIPSVDAVEVVRCKDCKWHRVTVIGLACDKHLMPLQTDDDDFCSYGERKTDGFD